MTNASSPQSVESPAGLLYVYYKLRAADVAAALAAFEATASQLGGRIGLQQRADEARAELITWMEIYPAERAAAEPQMAAALTPWVQGARHAERFVPVRGRC